jgi:hypothetical protein
VAAFSVNLGFFPVWKKMEKAGDLGKKVNLGA